MRISDWSSDVCSSDLARNWYDFAVGSRRRGGDNPGPVRGAPDARDASPEHPPHGAYGRYAAHWESIRCARCFDHKFPFPSRRTSKTMIRTGSGNPRRSEEHTSELQSLMRISYAVFCLKKKKLNKLLNK